MTIDWFPRCSLGCNWSHDTNTTLTALKQFIMVTLIISIIRFYPHCCKVKFLPWMIIRLPLWCLWRVMWCQAGGWCHPEPPMLLVTTMMAWHLLPGSRAAPLTARHPDCHPDMLTIPSHNTLEILDLSGHSPTLHPPLQTSAPLTISPVMNPNNTTCKYALNLITHPSFSKTSL